MKTLLLRAYPRKNGFTSRLTDLFAKGLLEGGADIVDRHLPSLDIRQCNGCYSCWITSPGKCVIRDDFAAVARDILDAGTIVCATPLYAYSVSSSLKNVLDRTLSLTKPTFQQSPGGPVRNAVRFPEKWPKKLAVILVGALKGIENFSAARAMFSLYANAMSMDLCGELVRPESYLLQFALAKPLTVKNIEAAFVKAGYELAANGAVSPETRERASTPLAPDLSYFSKYSTIYWEHAESMGEDAKDLALLSRTVTADPRILMQEMARSIDPAATAHVRAVLQFEFPDRNYAVSIAVDRGTCTFKEEKAPSPDLTVTVSSDVWAQVFMRQVNVRDALVNRQIVLKGDKFLFSRLDRYFPPPVT
jgi:multimeric flavodoxin WrbA/putative sterol carrier protein